MEAYRSIRDKLGRHSMVCLRIANLSSMRSLVSFCHILFPVSPCTVILTLMSAHKLWLLYCNRLRTLHNCPFLLVMFHYERYRVLNRAIH